MALEIVLSPSHRCRLLHPDDRETLFQRCGADLLRTYHLGSQQQSRALRELGDLRYFVILARLEFDARESTLRLLTLS